MQTHLEWNSEQLNKKIELEVTDPVKANRITVYLYKWLMTKKFEDDEFYPSEYTIEKYLEIMDHVMDFVLYNIQLLIELRMNQAKFSIVDTEIVKLKIGSAKNP